MSPTGREPIVGATAMGSSCHDIAEYLLLELAEDIPPNKLEKLGLHLKCDTAQIKRYEMTNCKGNTVTSVGTKEMLQDWYQKTSAREAYRDLREALSKAGLKRMADKHLPMSR